MWKYRPDKWVDSNLQGKIGRARISPIRSERIQKELSRLRISDLTALLICDPDTIHEQNYFICVGKNKQACFDGIAFLDSRGYGEKSSGLMNSPAPYQSDKNGLFGMAYFVEEHFDLRYIRSEFNRADIIFVFLRKLVSREGRRTYIDERVLRDCVDFSRSEWFASVKSPSPY